MVAGPQRADVRVGEDGEQGDSKGLPDASRCAAAIRGRMLVGKQAQKEEKIRWAMGQTTMSLRCAHVGNQVAGTKIARHC